MKKYFLIFLTATANLQGGLVEVYNHIQTFQHVVDQSLQSVEETEPLDLAFMNYLLGVRHALEHVERILELEMERNPGLDVKPGH